MAAAAVATAVGADAAAIADGVHIAAPPWRASPAGTLAGIPVVDDGMAATPSKTAALLRSRRPRSILLIAGGLNHAGGGLVHAAPEEVELLDRACDEVARTARAVVAFGEAAPRLVPRLEQRGVETATVTDLAEAVAAASEKARTNPALEAIIFSPLFPVALEDRERFHLLVEQHRR